MNDPLCANTEGLKMETNKRTLQAVYKGSLCLFWHDGSL